MSAVHHWQKRRRHILYSKLFVFTFRMRAKQKKKEMKKPPKETIFISTSKFHLFASLSANESNRIISPLRQIIHKMKWRKQHSARRKIDLPFFKQISTICCLIYLMSWYESRHFPFRFSYRNLQLFRPNALFMFILCIQFIRSFVSYAW